MTDVDWGYHSEDEARAHSGATSQEPPEAKVLAMIEGGIAEFITEGNVTVRIIDYDIDGASEDELHEVGGRPAFVGATIGSMPDNFEELWEQAGQ